MLYLYSKFYNFLVSISPQHSLSHDRPVELRCSCLKEDFILPLVFLPSKGLFRYVWRVRDQPSISPYEKTKIIPRCNRGIYLFLCTFICPGDYGCVSSKFVSLQICASVQLRFDPALLDRQALRESPPSSSGLPRNMEDTNRPSLIAFRVWHEI